MFRSEFQSVQFLEGRQKQPVVNLHSPEHPHRNTLWRSMYDGFRQYLTH